MGLFRKLLLTGAAFFLPLALADQYPDHAKSTRTTVTVNIAWLPTYQAVNAMCSFIDHTPIVHGNGMIFVGCYEPSTQTIYAVEPTSFNDLKRLTILGHEFWHALGAEHPD